MLKRFSQTPWVYIVILLTIILFVWLFLAHKNTEFQQHNQPITLPTASLTNKTNEQQTLNNNHHVINQSIADNINQPIETKQQHKLITNYDELALTEQLSEQQAYALSELSTQHVVNLLNNDSEKLTQTLQLIQTLVHSEQRAFLIRALQATNDVVKKQVSDELLLSSRVIDRKAAVALLMTLEEPQDKALLSQVVLQTETDDEVLTYTLAHMSADADKDTVARTSNEINTLANYHINPKVKGLALQVMMKLNPESEEVFEQVNQLVNSAEPEMSFQGLNILHQQLNDFGKTLNNEQKQALITQLTWIIDNNELPAENKAQAKLSLDVLNNHY